MSKLDQKITEINTQIPVLVRKKSNLLAIELGAKGGEGSGRYPSGSASQEKISETPKPYYPVTDKSQYVRDGLSSTSHDIIDVNIQKGETMGYDVVQVEAESRDPNAPKGETTTLKVAIFSKLNENGDVEVRVDKVQDPDRNEVGTSPAFDKILQANIRDAITTHNDYYKNPKKHMSELDRMIKGISQEIVQLEQKVSLLNRIDFASKGGAGSGRYPAGSSESSRLKDNPAQGMFNFDQPKVQTPTPSVPSKIESPAPSVIPKIEPPPPTPKQIWDASEAARVLNDSQFGSARQFEPARPYVEPPKVRTPEEQATAADLHAQSESNRIALAQNQQNHRTPYHGMDVAKRELQRRLDPLADPKVPLKPLPPPTVELPTSVIDGSGDEWRNNQRISYLNDRGERVTGAKPLPEPIPRRSGPGFGGRPNRMWRR